MYELTTHKMRDVPYIILPAFLDPFGDDQLPNPISSTFYGELGEGRKREQSPPSRGLFPRERKRVVRASYLSPQLLLVETRNLHALVASGNGAFGGTPGKKQGSKTLALFI